MLKNRHPYFIYILLILLIPVFGLVITFMMIVRRTIKIETDIHSRLAHLRMYENNVYPILKPMHEQEINLISIEEALVINDVNTRRNLLLNLLKKDATQRMDLLQKAVNNPDTETAHYAASALMEVKRKLLNLQQELANEYELKRKDLDFLNEYCEAIKLYLQNGALDRVTEHSYKKLYAQILTDLIEAGNNDWHLYVELIDVLLDLKDYHQAFEVCNVLLKLFPDREEPYVLMIKLFFLQNKRADMQQYMELLVHQKNMVLTMKTASLITFWQKGLLH